MLTCVFEPVFVCFWYHSYVYSLLWPRSSRLTTSIELGPSTHEIDIPLVSSNMIMIHTIHFPIRVGSPRLARAIKFSLMDPPERVAAQRLKQRRELTMSAAAAAPSLAVGSPEEREWDRKEENRGKPVWRVPPGSALSALVVYNTRTHNRLIQHNVLSWYLVGINMTKKPCPCRNAMAIVR